MTNIISIDYGLKRTGLALAEGNIAFAMEPIYGSKKEDVLNAVTKVIQEHAPQTIIVGLPLGIDEKETQMSKAVREFGEDLKQIFSGEIVFWNETLTSKQAAISLGRMKRKKSIDSESARIILQEFIDFKNE